MPDAGCRMPDVGCRLPDVGCRMSDAGCRMPDVGCRMSDAGCRMDVLLQTPGTRLGPADSTALYWFSAIEENQFERTRRIRGTSVSVDCGAVRFGFGAVPFSARPATRSAPVSGGARCSDPEFVGHRNYDRAQCQRNCGRVNWIFPTRSQYVGGNAMLMKTLPIKARITK
jgi:hypothetical protein